MQVRELIELLKRFPETAVVVLKIEPHEVAGLLSPSNGDDAGRFEVENVEPEGCNPNELNIRIGYEV